MKYFEAAIYPSLQQQFSCAVLDRDMSFHKNTVKNHNFFLLGTENHLLDEQQNCRFS